MGEDLAWALKNGDLDVLKSKVEKEGLNVDAAVDTVNERRPLHIVADYGHTDLMRYLLSKTANVNVPDKYGITPLLAAIYEGHYETVKLLLEKGADKSGKAPDGSSYLECAEDEQMKTLLK